MDPDFHRDDDPSYVLLDPSRMSKTKRPAFAGLFVDFDRLAIEIPPSILSERDK
jgi:hypothetical protein